MNKKLDATVMINDRQYVIQEDSREPESTNKKVLDQIRAL